VTGRRLLFLIGYRGAGKTEVARLLAPMLGWQWLDADAVMERVYGRSIREIFAHNGEDGFRARETLILRELCSLGEHVIATGGGVVLREENRALLKEGTVVWLQAPAEVLWKRIQADSNSVERRPNLAGGGLSEIEEMLRVRTPLYLECQDLTVDSSTQTPPQIAEAICSWFRQA
jgi:shikimate kinase